MDEPKIRLYPDGRPGSTKWHWELLLNGKKIAGGKSTGTQEMAFTAARAALVRERRDKQD